MSKRDILSNLKFGEIIAENERDNLKVYFVETEFWNRVVRDEVDIIYGEKGAGKSAIYVLIGAMEGDLFDKRILLTSAENVRGNAVFKALVTDPPASEREFTYLWKLYISALMATVLREYGVLDESAKPATTPLEEIGLLPAGAFNLGGLLRSAFDYVKRFRPNAVEGTVHLDPNTGLPTGVGGKIQFIEPNAKAREQGEISVDEIIAIFNRCLGKQKYNFWILMDRLDVAFEESDELEENALRALFRVYLDIAGDENIRLKIFLRSDIWNRITRKGFREATHLTRGETISWNDKSLFNLVIRRLLSNDVIIEAYGVDRNVVLQNEERQRALFDRVFPERVDYGAKKPLTFDWMLSRVEDGAGRRSPRDFILLLNELVKEEISRLERGGAETEGEILFDRSSFKTALPSVSRYRLERSLYAEHPQLRGWIEKLRRGKSELTLANLMEVWGEDEAGATAISDHLVEVGFFRKKTSEGTSYWIPFVYRPALELTQGRATQQNEDED